MKVLHVITGLGLGGAERQVKLLIEHSRHSADVVVLSRPGPIAEQLHGLGVHVRQLGMRGNTDLRAVGALARIIRRGGYDVVHLHLYRALVYGRVAARLVRAGPVIATEHSLGANHLEGRVPNRHVQRLYLATERWSDGTIAVSRTVLEQLVAWGVSASRVTVIPNAVPVERFAFDAGQRVAVRTELGYAERDIVIGAVGRLESVKRFDLVLQAAALCGHAARVLVVGEGPELGPLTSRAAALGLDGQVHFAGARPDVAPMLAAMDVLALPSESETFGIAAVEGVAAGLPVLYDRCPALSELPTGSAPGASHVEPRADLWASAIMQAASQTPRRHRIPPVIAERYGTVRVAAETDSLYERVVHEHPRRAHRAADAAERCKPLA